MPRGAAKLCNTASVELTRQATLAQLKWESEDWKAMKQV